MWKGCKDCNCNGANGCEWKSDSEDPDWVEPCKAIRDEAEQEKKILDSIKNENKTLTEQVRKILERSDYYLQKAKEYEQKLNECEKTLYANSPDWAGLQAQEIEELENKIKSLEAEANGLKMRLAKEHENFLECWASYSKVLSELQHVRNEDIKNTESNHHLAKRNYELEKLVDHWKLKYTCVCGHEYDYHNLETGDCGSCKCRNLRTSSTIEITSDDRNDK